MALIVGTNSYVSVADADTYFTERLGATAWTGATTGNKTAALLQACRTLERLRYIGSHPGSTQSLSWPREGATDPRGYGIASTVVPQAMKDAQCEEALALLQMAEDADAVSREMAQKQGIRDVVVGGVREVYGERRRLAGLLSEEAYALVRHYLLRSPV